MKRSQKITPATVATFLLPVWPADMIELSYRSTVRKRPQVTCSADAARLFRKCFHQIELQEQFLIMYLSKAHSVLGVADFFKGGIDGVRIDRRLIFAAALLLGATSMMVAHNHPSGNTKPGKADIDVTKQLALCAAQLEITLLDHLIVTRRGYYSMREEGDF